MKYKSQFASGLAKARKRLKRLDTELLAAIHQASAGNTDGACEMALQAEDTSENLTLLLRSLPAYTGSPTAAANALDVMRVNIPVEIGFTEAGWFSLRMPLLLPKKGGGSANYIRSFLYPAMQEFFEKAEPVRFTDCVLIYRHVYDAGRPQRRYRDHDNIELNMVTDIVALYVMEDDAPLCCRHYYCSAAGSAEHTEVYVVPRTSFGDFLLLEDQMPDEGVKLYAQRPVLLEKDVPEAD